ncbi:MAG TPA: dTDP-4-dehydrorhamnose 3,5-epimerase [Lacipirellulaceae bacterium]|nr:dTDP-4-dehydrorhamnose 3,5-epimerase [Lacipirellulaceae bacterium]HMP04383.1 dTDP-4-dehydrorhamnose 3,5-epimerase [Gemmatales bacterium]
MKFTATALPGVLVIDLERFTDERGYFARTFCRKEFAAHGLDPLVAQSATSFTARRGTLRGLHFQRPPHAEAKLVRCVRGAIWDVAVDLRPDSPTFKRWVATELNAAAQRSHYLPTGCAHGFITLTDDVEVCYQMSAHHEPAAATGVRWDDPAFAIAWPFAPLLLSERDRAWPDFTGGD